MKVINNVDAVAFVFDDLCHIDDNFQEGIFDVTVPFFDSKNH